MFISRLGNNSGVLKFIFVTAFLAMALSRVHADTPNCLGDAKELAGKMAELHFTADEVKSVQLTKKIGQWESYSATLEGHSGTMKLVYDFTFVLDFDSPCTVFEIKHSNF